MESERHENGDGGKYAYPPMTENESGDWRHVCKKHSGYREHGKTEAEPDSGKKILRDSSNEIAQTRVPPNDKKILRDCCTGAKTRLLDDFCQFHIINDFHGQSPVR